MVGQPLASIPRRKNGWVTSRMRAIVGAKKRGKFWIMTIPAGLWDEPSRWEFSTWRTMMATWSWVQHETPTLAVSAIRRWWLQVGRQREKSRKQPETCSRSPSGCSGEEKKWDCDTQNADTQPFGVGLPMRSLGNTSGSRPTEEQRRSRRKSIKRGPGKNVSNGAKDSSIFCCSCLRDCKTSPGGCASSRPWITIASNKMAPRGGK
jgi:hypothetical protein